MHDRGCSLRAIAGRSSRISTSTANCTVSSPILPPWWGPYGRDASGASSPHTRQIKYGIGRTGRVLLDLMTVRFLQGYSTRPMHIFGRADPGRRGAGFCALAYYLKLVLGQSIGGRPLLTLSVLLLLMGAQMVSIGLLGEMIMRTYYESPGKEMYRVRAIIDGSGTPPHGPA